MSDIKLDIQLLKNEKKVALFLRHVYIETVKGAILEYFVDNNIFDAWSQMQFFVDDLYMDDLIDDEERQDLVRFVNSVYLEFCDNSSKLRNSIIDIQNTLERGFNNGKGERRRNTNCGRNTRGNSASGKGKTDRNPAR